MHGRGPFFQLYNCCFFFLQVKRDMFFFCLLGDALTFWEKPHPFLMNSSFWVAILGHLMEDSEQTMAFQKDTLALVAYDPPMKTMYT